MTKEEFYNQVSAWSIHRRKLTEVIRQCTEIKLQMLNKEKHGQPVTEEEMDKEMELQKEQKRLKFIVNGIVDTLDAEVDRIEKMVLERPEVAQKLNRK